MKLDQKSLSVDADLLKAEADYAAADAELTRELAKVAIDVAGIVDPTPISDAISMRMSLTDEDYVGAGLSLLSMIPYAGDALAKTAKGVRATKKILHLQKKIAALAAKIRALKGAKVSKAASKAVSEAATKPASGAVCVPCTKPVKKAPVTKRGTLKPTKNRREAPVHHIATNKNPVSKARGGPWTPRFKPLFDRAGMSMDDVANTVAVPGHKGPHPEAYHSAVYDRLTNAVRGKNGLAYREALTEELRAIGREAATPGSLLNRLLTRK